ncbi:hypothetical protein DFH09DRAFT_1082338 [Mycena vulgaris]|nr:hypothetical protein DFH09DRAFT_1082338 [Mycena vulgaris]
MAVYYDEYGDYDPGPAAFYHPDFSDDPETGYGDSPAYDTFYGEAQYDPDERQFYEPCEEYGYAVGHADCYPSHPQVLERAEYVETSCGDAECMEIAYGEPGYWEEYHRRRYEIIHGLDCEEVAESPYVSENNGEVVGGAPFSEGLYDDVAVEVADVDAEAAGLLEVEVEAWQVMWERGPRVGENENELAWAEAMEAWRQRLETDLKNEEGVADVPESDISALVPSDDESPAIGDTPDPHESIAAPETLEELQAAYDHGQIPEADREECGRLLGELWACELGDQRLLAAGYVWDEELGKYVHPVETDSLAEYDDAADGLGSLYPDVEAVYIVNPVADLQLAATAVNPIQLPAARHSSRPRNPNSRPHLGPQKSTAVVHLRQLCGLLRQFDTARRFHRPAPRIRNPAAKSTGRKKHRPRALQRDPPPHIALVSSSSPLTPPHIPSSTNIGAMVPAPNATPPLVADKSRCSLPTVPIANSVPADVHVRKEPVPPNILDPTAAALVLSPAQDPAVDNFLIPRQPEPPSIKVDATATASVPVRTSVADAAVPFQF